jgi:hypothetical protein
VLADAAVAEQQLPVAEQQQQPLCFLLFAFCFLLTCMLVLLQFTATAGSDAQCGLH